MKSFSGCSINLSQQRFAILGGGISGLTAAYRLRPLMPDAQVDLFEASDRFGGFALAGNAYRGVGIRHCVRSGNEAARRLAVSAQESLC